MILDQFGRPIDIGTLREPQTSHTRYIQREFDQHPARGLTPEKLARVLMDAERGDLVEQVELADDIEERDGHIFAELGKRKTAVTGLDWEILPPKAASPQEEKLAAEVDEWLRGDASFGELLYDMMDAVNKGFAMHEMIWSQDGQRLVPSFTFQPQRWFRADASRRQIMLRSMSPQQTAEDIAAELPPVMGEPLKPWGWITHIHRSRSGYITRNGLCRMLAWTHLFTNYSIRDLAEFLEIFGLPLRLGTYPAGASDGEKRALMAAVVGVGHNAAGIIPAGMKIDFQKAAEGSEGPFVAMWDHMQAIASKVILGQTLSAQAGVRGSSQIAMVHNDVRIDIRDGDAQQLQNTLNAQLIVPYCLINHAGIDPRRCPRIRFDVGQQEDLQNYAENLPKLAAAGMQIGVDWAHEKLRIPKAEAGEPLLQAIATVGGNPQPASPPSVRPPAGAVPGVPPKPAPAGVPPKPAPAPAPAPATATAAANARLLATLVAQLAATQTAQAAQASAPTGWDTVIAEAASAWRPQLSPLVLPLLDALDKAVAAGESLTSFRARLPQLVPDTNALPFADALTRSAFLAHLAGAAGLDIDPTT